MAVKHLHELVPYAVNFSAVIGIVYYVAKEPIKKLVYQRHEHQKDRMNAAKAAEDEARARFNRIDDKLKKFEDNSSQFLKEKETEAQTEVKQLKEKALHEVDRIKKDAARIVSNEEQEAQKRLQKHVSDLAISQAETILKENLKMEDHHALITDARKHLGAEI